MAGRGFSGACAVLVGGALLPALPYMAAIEGVSHKTTADSMWRSLTDPAPRRPASVGALAPPLAAGHASMNADEPRHSMAWALGVVSAEIGKSFHYFVWVPALFGVW